MEEYNKILQEYADKIKYYESIGDLTTADQIKLLRKKFVNSVYPVESSNFYFFDPKLAEDITNAGKELINNMDNYLYTKKF